LKQLTERDLREGKSLFPDVAAARKGGCIGNHPALPSEKNSVYQTLKTVSRVPVVGLQLKPETLLIPAGEQARPGRCTDRRTAVGLGKGDALLSDGIHVRSMHMGAPVQGYVRLAQVIGEDDHNIGRTLLLGLPTVYRPAPSQSIKVRRFILKHTPVIVDSKAPAGEWEQQIGE
jgi:hypothetical protein